MDQEWQFWEARPAGWEWLCVDRQTGSVIKSSDRTFQQLYDCVANAKQHGYVPRSAPLPPPENNSDDKKK